VSETWWELEAELKRTDMSCVPEGIHQRQDIFRYVQRAYLSLCDDSIICKEVHKSSNSGPEWKHRVDTVLGYQRYKPESRVSKPSELRRGYWKFGPLSAHTRMRYTPEEIVLCTYVAMYDENDLVGLTIIAGLHGRGVGSLRMKRNNIASSLDQEGIVRETTFEALSGMPRGESGRRTNWEIVEPLLELSKLDFLLLCLNILEGKEFLTESPNQEEYVEGAMRIIVSKRYERNKEARDACIAHYGPRCHVPRCGFDFEEEFGELGKGFIHVHHVKPISERGAEYVVDPINDLIPVCPNCHSMIHRGNTTRDWRNILN
jgi:hypothetical protein